MPKDVWLDPFFADAYAHKVDPTDWYEQEVNMPAIEALLPPKDAHILDFGCASGTYTASLSSKYEIEGCDVSQPMIEIAKKNYPNIGFFQWDGVSPIPFEGQTYDAVYAKLVLMFMDDLAPLAKELVSILTNQGSFVFSVPHPFWTIHKAGEQYFDRAVYETDIGKSSLHTTMIHRSLKDYMQPFIDSGFILNGLTEPRVSEKHVQAHSLLAKDFIYPKRLVVRFVKG